MGLFTKIFGKEKESHEPIQARDEGDVEEVAGRISGKHVDIIVKYSELGNFVSPVILNLCVLRRIPLDLSKVIQAVCPVCGVGIKTEWLQLAAGRIVPVAGLGSKCCQKCGADHFKAIFLDITAEELVRLGKDQSFSKLSALS